MSRSNLCAAFALFLMNVAPLQAQIGGGPVRSTGGRPGLVYGGFQGARLSGDRAGGLVWGYPGRFGFGLPFGFPGVPLSLGFAPATLVVVPPVAMTGGGFPTAPPTPPPSDDDMPPALKPGDHLVIRPKRALPLLPPPDAPPAKPLPLPPRAPDLDPFTPMKPVNVDKPDPDPVKEVARLVKLGKDAFAAGEFGAAGEQFNRGIAVNPKNALPQFLNAQAAFAAGRYADAVAAIRAGLDLDRTWPTSPFDPKELYGPNPATFNEHLAALRTAVAANPGEPILEFLLGYELWFIGEKVEAKKWFDLAEKRLPAPGPIALFK